MMGIFDRVAAVLGLFVLSPLLLVLALAVRIGLGRPVLFRQLRPGLHGRPFMLVKFRTMRNAPDAGPASDAARLTRLGRFLRASSLDELPELWNVARGEMRLVGPRPLLMAYLDRYSADQMRRHDVPPGITGWAQVNGRNALSWDEKFAYDLWYVDHRSWWLDLRILAMTALRIVQRDGVSQPGKATAEEFLGSAA